MRRKRTPAAQRLAVFKKLWDDYTFAAAEDSIRAVAPAQVLMFTPEAIPQLLSDPSPEAQILVRDAIAKGMEGPTDRSVAMPRARRTGM